MRFAYADPPYVGQAKKHYGRHVDFAGEVDHAALVDRMCDEFDGWALSLSMKSLPALLRLCPIDVTVLAWFKPISPPLGDHRRYNWEPVILRPVRRYEPGYAPTATIASPPQFTFRKKPESHVIGEKPEAFAHWVFASAGLTRDDELVDLFPGSGAIGRAWETYDAGPTVSDGYQQARSARMTFADRVEAGHGPHGCVDGLFWIAASQGVLEPLTADDIAHLSRDTEPA